MEEEKKHIDEWIAAYLAGELEGSALEALKEWIAASSDHESYFSQRRELWVSALSEKEELLYDKKRAFDQFKKRIASREAAERTLPRKHFSWVALWRYAAVVLVLCMVSYFSYWQGGARVKGEFADMVVEAPDGSRTKLYLPDGTLVWLNAGSRIVYSQGFGVDNRDVELSGEGYFEVKRNEEIPFEVKTKDLTVRVLGTIFNFRDYPEDTEVIVSLLEGKVALTNLLRSEKETLLLPNERMVLNKQSGNMQIESVVATNAFQWTNGYLFFDEELLTDIAKELERSYNVEIQIANEELKKYRFYGNFVRREQSIREVLETLSSTRKIEYTIEGRNITLY